MSYFCELYNGPSCLLSSHRVHLVLFVRHCSLSFLNSFPVSLFSYSRTNFFGLIFFRFRTTIRISNHCLTWKLKIASTEGFEAPFFDSTAAGLAVRFLRSFFNSVSLQWMTLLKCKVALDATCPVTSSIFHFLINDGFVTSFFPFSCMIGVFDLFSTRNIKDTTTDGFEPLMFGFESGAFPLGYAARWGLSQFWFILVSYFCELYNGPRCLLSSHRVHLLLFVRHCSLSFFLELQSS